MTILFFILLSYTSLNAQESTIEFKSAPQECGLYLIHGTIKSSNQSKPTILLLVNEGTKSEHTFTFAKVEDDLGYNLYKDKEVALTAHLLKKLNGTSGEISKVAEIKKRIPNPIGAKHTGFHLIQKMKCLN